MDDNKVLCPHCFNRVAVVVDGADPEYCPVCGLVIVYPKGEPSK